jgi:hypothetical protein
MIDSFHGSEWVYLQPYLHMLDALPEVLGRYSDWQALQKIVQAASANRYDLFGQGR